MQSFKHLQPCLWEPEGTPGHTESAEVNQAPSYIYYSLLSGKQAVYLFLWIDYHACFSFFPRCVSVSARPSAPNNVSCVVYWWTFLAVITRANSWLLLSFHPKKWIFCVNKPHFSLLSHFLGAHSICAHPWVSLLMKMLLHDPITSLRHSSWSPSLNISISLLRGRLCD